ncbi:hypothetical protein [Sphingomonas sp.]|uniref:hypothetical protein n=1 Tax=Sphingomonas sp. TaxID=28214 RepID=UPI003CC58104
MTNHELERLISQVGEEAAAERDDLACYMEGKEINRAFARIDSSADGLDAEGLGDDADRALELLRTRLGLTTGERPTAEEIERTLLIAVPVGLLSAAITVTRLPTRDDSKLARIRKIKDGGKLDADRAKLHSIVESLQPLTITVLSGRMVLRNRISGIEVECPVPARAVGERLPAEGIAFQTKYSFLAQLLAERGQAVPAAIRRSQKSERKSLLLLRLDPARSAIEYILGSTLLSLPVVHEPAPQRLLSGLPVEQAAHPLAAASIAKGLTIAKQLGVDDFDVVRVTGGSLLLRGYHALRYTAPDLVDHDITIPAELVGQLAFMLRWTGSGAEIRRSRSHYVVTKQNVVFTFAAGRPLDIAFDEIATKIRDGSVLLSVNGEQLLTSLLTCLIVRGRQTDEFYAALKLFASSASTVALGAVDTTHGPNVSKAQQHIDAVYEHGSTEDDALIGLNVDLWARLLAISPTPRADLVTNPTLRAAIVQFDTECTRTEVILRTDQTNNSSLIACCDELVANNPTLEVSEAGISLVEKAALPVSNVAKKRRNLKLVPA